MTIHIFHAFYQLLVWKHVCFICFYEEQSDCPVTMETSVLGNFFQIVQHVLQHHASQFLSFCLLINHLCIIKMMFFCHFDRKQALSYHGNKQTIKTAPELWDYYYYIMLSYTCGSYWLLCGFTIAFSWKRVLAAIFRKKMVARLPWKQVNCTQMPANFAACVVASNIIANCELSILFCDSIFSLLWNRCFNGHFKQENGCLVTMETREPLQNACTLCCSSGLFMYWM